MSRATDRRVRRLYADIPPVECISGCHQCCGSAPWAPIEFKRVRAVVKARELPTTAIPGAVVVGAVGQDCPFLTCEGCGVYKDRPAVCRLFGAVDHAILRCPAGVVAAKPLSRLESSKIIAAIRQEAP